MVSEIPIGSMLGASEPSPAFVLAKKLNRHTFWCGQSGSGKTYALGVLLEQVLLHLRLPIIVLDPNSDFVRLSETRADAPLEWAAKLADRDIRVLHSGAEHAEHADPNGGPPGEQLKVRYVDMGVRSRAAVLQLDPVLDAEEFNSLLATESEIMRNHGHGERGALVSWLRAHDDPARHRIATRLENLGVAEWDLWAWGGRDVTDVIDERADATVIDLGGFDTSTEPKAAALAVLDHLWENRHDRIGRLIVIDEAHNLCRPDPSTPLEKLLTERIVQIAAEGRKYGLWLLLSTQRPSKVHPNAISQCDNLGLMKMSSPRDLAELALVFGFAPEALLAQAASFTQGQALFAGGFTSEAHLVQMGSRLTHEGGTDVPIIMR